MSKAIVLTVIGMLMILAIIAYKSGKLAMRLIGDEGNKETTRENIAKLKSVILDIVIIQMSLDSNPDETFNSEFFLGYLHGFSDAWMQSLDINNHSDRLDVFLFLLSSSAGLNNFKCLTRKFMALQDNPTEEYSNGVKIGIDDFFLFLKGCCVTGLLSRGNQ